MPKRQIVRMSGEDGLTCVDYFSEYETTVDENPILTVEELADMCDQNAESRNHHGFVGVHHMLAVILNDVAGRDEATVIMRDIAEYGGLDGIKFGDFGMEQSFAKWELVDKE